MISCITARDALPFITPIIPFVLGLWAARILDRRKALCAVRGRIQSTVDEFGDTGADLVGIHRASLSFLKDSIFAALPLLSEHKQNKIKEVWANYRKIPAHEFTETDNKLTEAICKSLGYPINNRKDAIMKSLAALESSIK